MGLGVIRVFSADGAAAAPSQLDVFTMGMGLLGGLALFLFGMEQMADALKDILSRLTTNRVMGAITGAIVTAIIQSSSVTTVLTVGFITAGILSLSQAVGIIFGANIGTTLTAQIIAFKVTKFALLMIAAGFAMLFISKNERTKQLGGMIMGLGLAFFGMSVMSGAMKPLRSYGPFLDLMQHMSNPLLAILVAALFSHDWCRHRHGGSGADQPGGRHRVDLRGQCRHLHYCSARLYRQDPRGHTGQSGAHSFQRHRGVDLD